MNFLDYDSYGTCFRRYSSFLSSAHFELGGDGGPLHCAPTARGAALCVAKTRVASAPSTGGQPPYRPGETGFGGQFFDLLVKPHSPSGEDGGSLEGL